MALFTTLYSGSSGNCGLILQDKQYLLVDMGKSCRTTLSALRKLDLAISDCAGILITHEHSDHVAGLDTFLKNTRFRYMHGQIHWIRWIPAVHCLRLWKRWPWMGNKRWMSDLSG